MTVNSGKIAAGLVSETTHEVKAAWSAITLGSGTFNVLGTPAMAIVAEQICREMVDPLLDESQATVGTRLNIRHLAPTPVGDAIRLRAEVVSIERNIITFEIKIWDSVELVGKADHQRAIIDIERFLKRIHSKPPHSH
jgi:fluoroacetyl-CoA thioesterase